MERRRKKQKNTGKGLKKKNAGIEKNKRRDTFYSDYFTECKHQQETIKMGRQYNKVQKRVRRKNYLERVKVKIHEAIKSAKKK